MESALISTEDAAALLARPGARAVDASWHMPSAGRDAAAEYAAEHLPGAVFFDIDAISDHASSLPHMLPPVPEFERAAGALGISREDTLVVYDSLGLFSAARAWWMFRVFGHEKVYVLSGGLPKWKAEGRALEAGRAMPPRGEYAAAFSPGLVKDLAQVKSALANGGQLADARAAGRFRGEEPEPRAGLRSGHIPGSANLPFKECLAGPYSQMRGAEELQSLFRAAGVDPRKPVIASCGSGVTACVLALALYELGQTDAAVYDGSWAEWGASGEPVAVGESSLKAGFKYQSA